MSDPVRSEVEAALERWVHWNPNLPGNVGVGRDFDLVLAAARAWLSTPTEPTDEMDYEAAARVLRDESRRYQLGWNPLPFDELAKQVVEAAAGRVQTEEKP